MTRDSHDHHRDRDRRGAPRANRRGCQSSWRTPTRSTSRPTTTTGTSPDRCSRRSTCSLSSSTTSSHSRWTRSPRESRSRRVGTGYLPTVRRAVGHRRNADRSGGTEMLSWLVTANETVVRTARTALPVADEAGDQPTADLLSERLRVHEKDAWMLRSLLE